ncbi:TPA: chorismate lyase [Legionella pneumophila]|uniref:chorismate--pyruvate lyase family protein n=1 Tax=Legionella sp. PATHC032 TaxID=2992039 RepID=UPI001A2B86B0|nr:chorismate lyase [Legionella sp. PATHC032]MCW8421309.1 chorismate lyase [Legionella sp. PATHC032]HAT9046478.1 chorismate lyase [Legionella pneumophila subsp. pneumophila]HAZ7573144.1 chorismate lyase [Legionella pneumophila]HBA1635683.1 chorismate lyase [Legionella pneumophila]
MPINYQSLLIADAKEPELLKDWLEYQDSLTDKLKAMTGNAELERLSQNWSIPNWWDKYVLCIQDNSILQREIVMKNQGIVYWYARSVIPQSCYALKPEFFNRLENESIRNLIFDESSVRRLPILCYPVDQLNLEFHWVKKYISSEYSQMWVRFTELVFQEKCSFYLVEILLPELENLL